MAVRESHTEGMNVPVPCPHVGTAQLAGSVPQEDPPIYHRQTRDQELEQLPLIKLLLPTREGLQAHRF